MEVVVLTNLKLYETLEDKMTYVENFYRRYFNNVFRDKKYVINLYETKFNNKTILESELDFTGYIKNVHNFIKKAINFDCLVEQTMLQSAVTTGNKEHLKMAGATKDFSWSEFFETIRKGLSSTVGQISTTILELIKPLGHASVVIVWGGLAIYDFWNYIKNNDISSLSKFFIDLIAIGLTFLPTPGEDKLIRGLGETTFKSLDEFVRFFIEDPFGQTYATFVSKFIGLLTSITDSIKKGVDWLVKKFKITWPSEVVGQVTKILQDMKLAFEKAGLKPIMGKTFEKDVQVAAQDSSIPKPVHADFMRDKLGQPMGYKPKPWEKTPVRQNN